jgi:flagellar biosynthetic protein FliP
MTVRTAIFWSVLVGFMLLAQTALAQDPLSMTALRVGQDADGETTYSLSLQILALMTALTVLPSIVLGMTSFTRIIIVLSILRQALGTQQTPPNQVLIAIALFLSLSIMAPVLDAIYTTALSPYLAEEIAADDAMRLGSDLLKDFMVANTQEDTLLMFSDLAADDGYTDTSAIPISVILPAFITSELKTAFQIGFLIFLPFLVIDMAIASILMSLGMMMLSPMLISLPFKLRLFVLVDGWAMTVGSLAATFALGTGG